MANEYISVDEFKAATSSGITRTKSDFEIQIAVESASRAIDDAVNRRFYQDAAVVDRFYTAPTVPSRYYWQREIPTIVVDDISTATGLIVKTDPGDDGTYEQVWTLGVDYRLAPINNAADELPWTQIERIRTGNYSFPPHLHRVQVTAKFGWPTVPVAIQQATLLQAQRLFFRRQAPFGVAGAGAGAGHGDIGVIRLLNKIDPDVEVLIKPYTRILLPGQTIAVA